MEEIAEKIESLSRTSSILPVLTTFQPSFKKSMHNYKVFRALLFQLEKSLSDEMDRLTVKNRLWRMLAKLQLLPCRNKTGYGSFVKSADIRLGKKLNLPNAIYINFRLGKQK